MTFKNLGNYHIWTGDRMRIAIEKLEEKEFTQEIAGKTVKGICEHIVAALETCFFIADQATDKSVFNRIESLSKHELLTRWEVLDQRLGRIIQEIPQGDIEVSHVSEEPITINLFDFYLQYLLHTTHHRGQLAILLKTLGEEVPGTDYLMYFADKASR